MLISAVKRWHVLDEAAAARQQHIDTCQAAQEARLEAMSMRISEATDNLGSHCLCLF